MRPRRQRAVRTAIQVVALLIAARTGAAAPARNFASLPDWSGLWQTEVAAAAQNFGTPGPAPKLWGKPPYTAQAEKQYSPHGFPLANARTFQEGFNALFAAGGSETATNGCSKALISRQALLPIVMEMPFPDGMFEMLVTPKQTLFLDVGGNVRHIYTDGRPHPDPKDLWPTPMGDSIGRWEANTLIVDTIDAQPGSVWPGPGVANLSAQAHYTERLRRIGADSLEDRMTIDDPLRFTHPWQLSIRYTRVKDVNFMIPTGCDHDRNPVVNGKIIVAPPR